MTSFQQRISLAGATLLLLTLTVACGGGGGGTPPPPGTAPTNLQYPIDPGLYRAGETITPNVPTVQGGTPTQWSVQPDLPGGLMLTANGTLQGTPAAETPSAQYTITASNGDGQTADVVTIAIGPALPAAFASLAEGFTAEVVIEPGAPSPAKIAKFALAPPLDGRIFYLEVDTGQVRVIDPVSGLLATPFVTLDVMQGGHMGLLGLVLAPDFGVSGHVYVLACIPGTAMPPTSDRIQVLRYTDVGSIGTNETIVLDDLPVAEPGGINNGGELLFDASGRLLVSLGDVMVPSNAQADTSVSLAGKVLRYDVGVIPAVAASGNPMANDPEWCRGLRNTFGLAVHPTTGNVYGADNGDAADDALNFLQPGKNFGWGGTPPPSEKGFTMRPYPTVVVPTALCWHDGTTWGAAFEDNLFMTTYADHEIRRFVVSGVDHTDIDSESVFAAFVVSGTANHPLDVCRAVDGSLYVSTFSGIYRISKQ